MNIKEEVYKKNADFVYRDIAGETILVPIRKAIKQLQSIYSLNHTACAVWKAIDGKRRLKEIVDSIAGEYDTDQETIARDAAEFISRLKELGAIECAG